MRKTLLLTAYIYLSFLCFIPQIPVWSKTPPKPAENSMDTYKEDTKKVYDERMKSVQSNLNKIEEYEKLGGSLIPQGTVIFNDTGKEIKPRITSYADPNWIGVHAPSDQFQEGQQELYSYNASAFSSMSLISRKYIELGTPLGQAIFNADEGFLEYVSSLPYIYKLDKKGKVIYDTLNNKNKINEKIPDYFGHPMLGMNYDITHDLSWGVNVDRNTYYPDAGVCFYSVFSNLNWLYGYKYDQSTDFVKQNPTKIIYQPEFNVNINKSYYGSLFDIQNKIFFGNVLYVGSNSNFQTKNIYTLISEKEVMIGVDKTGFTKSSSGKYVISVKEKKIFLGIPSFFGLPYSYDWNHNSDNEENLWIDIYPIQSDTTLKRIFVKNLKIGEKVKKFVEKSGVKRKMGKTPEVKYIRFISDDANGLIYFDIKLDMELYDFAPLIMAIDWEGNLKLLARLWSAAGDVRAIKESARMGSGFYDYRAVLTANGDIFTIWNGSKRVGVGKVEFLK